MARESAAIVLVRPADPVPELLMVLRDAAAPFGASYVFPGGVLEPNDTHAEPYSDGLSEAAASARLGLQQGGLAYFTGAVRELFEETGVLLARSLHGDEVDADTLGRARGALNAGQCTWVEFLREAELRLTCEALHYFAHWVTPVQFEKRFNTRFFMAAMPMGQHATECGGEITEVRWLSAPRALGLADAGRIQLPRPTRAKLEQLATFSSTTAMFDWSRGRAAAGVECIRPAVVEAAGSRRVVLPSDPDYPGT